ASGLGLIAAAGVKQIAERPASIDRHQEPSFFLAAAVQADAEAIRTPLGGHAEDARHDADGIDGDPRGCDTEGPRVAHDIERRHHVVVVVQRLTHAHEHDVTQALPPYGQAPDDESHLAYDFSRRKVSHETHLPR